MSVHKLHSMVGYPDGIILLTPTLSGPKQIMGEYDQEGCVKFNAHQEPVDIFSKVAEAVFNDL